MKSFRQAMGHFLVIAALAVNFVPVAQAANPATELYKGTVIRVFDGGGFTIQNALEQLRVKLFGIDVPERGQPGGVEAVAFLEDLLMGATVIIHTLRTDKYERDVSVVVLPDGELVQEKLLQVGFARVDTEFCDIPRCEAWRAMESQAQMRRDGIWKDEDMTNLRYWRNEKLKRP